MGACAASSAEGDDEFITSCFLQRCPFEKDGDVESALQHPESNLSATFRTDTFWTYERLEYISVYGATSAHPINLGWQKKFIFGGPQRHSM